MAFLAKIVANCFLQRDFEDGRATISPMKLQKLVYLLHGWNLAIANEPAIDSQFLAWPYGPVEEGLYHIFKPFRGNPITEYAMSWDGDEKKALVVEKADNEIFYKIFDFVVSRYMPMTALQLSTLTHQPGTPWSITRGKREMVIPNELIKEHFKGIASK